MPGDVFLTFSHSGHVYAMPRAQADAFVRKCGEEVPHGIFAVEREGRIELRNDRMAPEKVAQAVTRWAADGWIVHYNL